jgi:hypothetical protein
MAIRKAVLVVLCIDFPLCLFIHLFIHSPRLTVLLPGTIRKAVDVRLAHTDRLFDLRKKLLRSGRAAPTPPVLATGLPAWLAPAIDAPFGVHQDKQWIENQRRHQSIIGLCFSGFLMLPHQSDSVPGCVLLGSYYQFAPAQSNRHVT